MKSRICRNLALFLITLASPAQAEEPSKPQPASKPGQYRPEERVESIQEKRVQFIDEDGDGINDIVQGNMGDTAGSRFKDSGRRSFSGYGLFIDNESGGHGQHNGTGSQRKGGGR